jgi:hypothetical protein
VWGEVRPLPTLEPLLLSLPLVDPFPFVETKDWAMWKSSLRLKYAEIFVQDTERDDCKKGQDEVCMGSNVPPPKHDTSVDDICVPEMGNMT